MIDSNRSNGTEQVGPECFFRPAPSGDCRNYFDESFLGHVISVGSVAQQSSGKPMCRAMVSVIERFDGRGMSFADGPNEI
ncbi:hypothetical protein ABIA52_000058 [Paenarthrobacter histidinolovorans]|uniref:Uncharacterized protein n=1 Tax=Paenarthrobacter histidinolovorans TaxID=43664 RepID=A0ABW8MZL1_9MICC